jgi:hypothetical protein
MAKYTLEEVKEKLAKSFNKGNMTLILEFVKSEELSIDELITLCKPQRAGGDLKNPDKEIDGELHAWCRLANAYIPFAEITVSNDKSKGVGKTAAKVAYRVEKAAQELRDSSIPLFQAGKYQEGGEKIAEADKVKALLDDPKNFTFEAMRGGHMSEYNPDYKSEKESKDESLV